MNGPAGRPEPRIGDKERDAAVAALGEHFAAGRITQEEFDERSSAAWQARTASQLAPLFADLPLPHGVPYQGWPPPQGARPGFGAPRGYPHPPRYPASPPPGHRHGRGSAWKAVLLVVVAIALAPHWPFIFIGLLVWAALIWSGRGRSCGQTSGSRRDSRGTWS
jgi:hypothetical protein